MTSCDVSRERARPDDRWTPAVRKARAWAWLHNVRITRIRWQHGDITFYARPGQPDPRRRYRAMCLCGWVTAAPKMETMAAARSAHREARPCHFVGEWCLHATELLKTRDDGTIICLDCDVSIGRDTL